MVCVGLVLEKTDVYMCTWYLVFYENTLIVENGIHNMRSKYFLNDCSKGTFESLSDEKIIVYQ